MTNIERSSGHTIHHPRVLHHPLRICLELRDIELLNLLDVSYKPLLHPEDHLRSLGGNPLSHQKLVLHQLAAVSFLIYHL